MLKDRVTVRLGSLRKSAEKRIAKLKLTPSEWVRWLMSRDLGEEPPMMKSGNPNFGKHKNG